MSEQHLKEQIIIVDDDPISIFLTEEILFDRFKNINVEHFTKAEECLKFLLKESKERIILLDLNMPEMNGWNFIDQFKKMKLRDRIFVLTASINEDDLNRAAKEEVGFLTKPLDINKLISSIFGENKV
jgi:CheY-like chemotaxis protein